MWNSFHQGSRRKIGWHREKLKSWGRDYNKRKLWVYWEGSKKLKYMTRTCMELAPLMVKFYVRERVEEKSEGKNIALDGQKLYFIQEVIKMRKAERIRMEVIIRTGCSFFPLTYIPALSWFASLWISRLLTWILHSQFACISSWSH